MKVLIADDAPLIRDRLARRVSDVANVAQILESRDYAETLQTIRSDRPDAMLLDLFMPGGTGLDVMREIAMDEHRPRVIVMTAWADNELRDLCRNAGAEYFFEKGDGFIGAIEALESMAAEQLQRTRGEQTLLEQDVPLQLPPVVAAPTVQDMTVLIVEDHAIQRLMLAHLLRSFGVTRILEASDGAQALEQLQRVHNAVHLILCDLDMPKMDGMEFMRHLGDTDCEAALVITSVQDPAVLNSVHAMCQAYGIRPLGALEKPVKPDTLRKLLASAITPRAAPAASPAKGRPDFTLEQILEGVRLRQFEPYFQAKADFATGRIVGAEALARWIHPELGVIPPFAFISQLEQAGRISALTFLMLERAAAACQSWRARGMDLNVSVNLSQVALDDTTLADRINATVRSAGLEPSHLILEVTETAAMTQLAPALENLARLRLRGFGLSIDDYGTGFASMQQLGRVAFTELKIDRCFVAAMGSKREALAIVESSVDMSRKLGLTSVAEGVETQAEWDTLKAAGCNVAQGFFLSHPVTDQEFFALSARHQK